MMIDKMQIVFREEGFEDDGEYDWIIVKREKIKQQAQLEETERLKQKMALLDKSYGSAGKLRVKRSSDVKDIKE